MTLDGASCSSQVTRAIFAAHQYRTRPKGAVHAAAAHCATPIVPSSMRDFGKRSNAVLLVNAGEELNQLGDFFFCETRFEPLFVLVYGALGDCERAASRFRKVQRLLAPITS